MGMYPFHALFPELAKAETRSLTLREPLTEGGVVLLPADDYGFFELYCTERGCDCRRVMVNVMAHHAKAHLATINHGFDKPREDDEIPDQTILDPLNVQSVWSEALLDVFIHVVLADAAYHRRLMQHYRIFKSAVESRTHPCQKILRKLERTS